MQRRGFQEKTSVFFKISIRRIKRPISKLISAWKRAMRIAPPTPRRDLAISSCFQNLRLTNEEKLSFDNPKAPSVTSKSPKNNKNSSILLINQLLRCGLRLAARTLCNKRIEVKGVRGKRCQEPFFGLPRGRMVVSNLNFLMVRSVHASEPKGLPLVIAHRIASTSSSDCGSFKSVA